MCEVLGIERNLKSCLLVFVWERFISGNLLCFSLEIAEIITIIIFTIAGVKREISNELNMEKEKWREKNG